MAPARVGRLRRATAPSTPSNTKAHVARAVSNQELAGAESRATSTAQPATMLTSDARKTVTKSAGPIGSRSRLRRAPTAITTVATTAGSIASQVWVDGSWVNGPAIRAPTPAAANVISKTTYTVKKCVEKTRAEVVGMREVPVPAITQAYERERSHHQAG